MKALTILGSRNPGGRTANAARALEEGLHAGGCRTELVFLPELQIERCRQREEDGWGQCRSRDSCVIDDDFPSLLGKIRASDAAVFATPVYYSDLSESMKAFLDRLRRVSRDDEQGIRGKLALGISVVGGGGGGAPACVASLQKALGGCGFDVVDMIPARRQNLDMKKGVLRTTGQWLAGLANVSEG